MSRPLADITDELLRLAHRLWDATDDARATIKGLAASILKLEDTGEAVSDEAFRQTATTEYLDLHGREAGKGRFPYETDAQWRERAFLSPRGTITWLRERIDHEIESLGYEGYNVLVFLPRETQQFADCSDSIVGDHDAGHWPRHAVVSIPPMDAPTVSGVAYADEGFADDAFANETTDSRDRYIHRRIEKAVEIARQSGMVITIVYRRERGLNASLPEFTGHLFDHEVGLL